jgi:DNA-binding MarR family transcriptional regulator
VLGPFGRAVGFLVSQTGTATSRRFKEALEDLELEPRQFALMRAIDAAQSPTQQFLSDVLQIPASSMVALLDHLEAMSLVARRPHPTDRRARVVVLTEAARAVLVRATEVAIATEQAICRGLSEQEREALIELLLRVAANLGLAEGVHPGMPTRAPCGGE